MDSLFLVVMVPALRKEGKIYLEKQAFNGIEKWAENFEFINVVFPETIAGKEYTSIEWVLLDEINCLNRLNVILLPLNYKVINFLFYVIKYRKVLLDQIKNNRYRVFSIGGITGDWGAIAAIISLFCKKDYAVWTDRVEHRVVKEISKKKSIIKRFYNSIIISNLMKYYHRFIINKASLSLLHGNDCYNEYSRYSKQSFMVHNIHYNEHDQIRDENLKIKIENCLNEKPLKICYVGRVDEMKGPFEWLEILLELKRKKVQYSAKWLGDGEFKYKITNRINALELEKEIDFVGFISEKELIKKEIESSDIFLFCHKTPESPRNLIESLKGGTPIVGFYSEYAADLISENNGGILVKNFDTKKIADIIEELYNDKGKLAKLVKNSSLDGEKFDDKKVFRHRSELVKEYL